MYKISGLVIFVFVFAFMGCGQKGSNLGPSNPSKVLATVNGESILEKDVMVAVESQLKKVEAELYKIKKMGLDQVIEEKLIEQAAKKQGKTTEAYLKEQVEDQITEPTEDEMKQFYELRKKQAGGKSFDEVKDTIVEFLKGNQQNAKRRQLLGGLRASAKVSIKLEPPRVDVKVGDSPSIGPKGAPVTVVEFSDYQCPFCGRARATINKMIETYPKEVRYVFRDFPLSFHQLAPKAHEAAHCAGDEDKYWEYNKILFENQRALTPGDLQKYAKKVGVNAGKFKKCLDDGKYEERVKNDVKEGSEAGVSGTPAFFVNGVMLSGARPFSAFKEMIDAELARK